MFTELFQLRLYCNLKVSKYTKQNTKTALISFILSTIMCGHFSQDLLYQYKNISTEYALLRPCQIYIFNKLPIVQWADEKSQSGGLLARLSFSSEQRENSLEAE